MAQAKAVVERLTLQARAQAECLCHCGKLLTLAAFIAGCLQGQSLRDLAAERGIKLGAAVDPNRLTETAYATTLAREFNEIEPENVTKFGPIHPGINTYNFGPADTLVNFAKASNMALRGHTLVWHNQNPDWLTKGGFSATQLNGILKDHITTVVKHFAGAAYAWDVVNEAFNDNGTLRSTLWYDAPGIGLNGTGYIEQALRWAHDADPAAHLFYNDYSAEQTNVKSDAIYAMAQDFLKRGVPLNGIGMQMHLTTNLGSIASMESNIRRLTGLGLEVQITELDVRLPVDASGAASAASLQTEAQIYESITNLCLKFSLCTMVQTWGFTDRYSWIPGTYPGNGAALPLDANYQPKPAYDAMKRALQTAPPAIASSGLVNAASYQGGVVSPGEIVILFGANFGTPGIQTAQLDSQGRIASSVANTRLLFDGAPAPLLYTKVGQTGAVVPFGVAGRASTQVEYEYRGIRSNAVTIAGAAAHPGLFSADSSGGGSAAVLNAAFQPVSEQNPARGGDAILLFATGGGTFDRVPADGEVVPSAPYPLLQSTVSVTIGGVDCRVLYAGQAPGLVAGAVQINAQVAAGIPAGPRPIVVSVGGVASQPNMFIWIQ